MANDDSCSLVYEDAFETKDKKTLEELRFMTAIHSSFRLAQPQLLEYSDRRLRYVTALCKLSRAVVLLYPELRSKTPLLWHHDGIQCNCIWFELIRRGMDEARRFAAKCLNLVGDAPTDHESLIQKARTVIGCLRYLSHVAFPSWTDAPDHPSSYSVQACLELTQLVRCIAVFHFARLKTVRDIPAARSVKENFEASKDALSLYLLAYHLLLQLPDKIDLGIANRTATFTQVEPLDLRDTDKTATNRASAPASYKILTWPFTVQQITLLALADFYWRTAAGDAMLVYRILAKNLVFIPDLDQKELDRKQVFAKTVPDIHRFHQMLREEMADPDTLSQGCSPIVTEKTHAMPSLPVCEMLFCGCSAFDFKLEES